MKRLPVILLIIILLVGAGFVFDRLAAIKPAMPPLREGEPEPARPLPEDEPFHTTPLALTFEERRQLYYEWVLNKPTSDDRGGVWTDIVKLAAGEASINYPSSRQPSISSKTAKILPIFT